MQQKGSDCSLSAIILMCNQNILTIVTFNLLFCFSMWNWTRKLIKLTNKLHVTYLAVRVIDWCSISPQIARRWFFENPKVVSLPSTRTKKARGEIKYSVLRVLIFMYIQHRGLFIFFLMNNHRRKRSPLCWSSALWEWNNCFSHISSYCNEMVAAPDTEWQITPRFNHTGVGLWGWCER